MRVGEVGGCVERGRGFGERGGELRGMDAKLRLVDEDGLVPRLLKDRVIAPWRGPPDPDGGDEAARQNEKGQLDLCGRPGRNLNLHTRCG